MRRDPASRKVIWTFSAVGALVAACALSLAVGCARDAFGPRPPAWAQYASAAWTYRYEEPGYAEGLRDVSGTLVLARAPSRDSITIAAPSGVRATFWYTTATGDTATYVAAVWLPNGYVYRAIVTPTDTFTVVSSNAPDGWPGLGPYVQAGDSITFTWDDAAYGNGRVLLQIVYRRVP